MGCPTQKAEFVQKFSKMAAKTWDEVVAFAQITAAAKEYLEARKLDRLSVIANLPKERFITMVVDPFLSDVGFAKDGKTYKCTEDEVYEMGTIITVWEEARRIRDAEIAPPAAIPTAAAAALGGGSSSTIMPFPPAIPKPTGPEKRLRPGVFKAQVDKYNNKFSPKKVRVFPQRLIFGAEALLSRVLYEKNESRVFSPIPLGEVPATRTYTSDEQINIRAAKDAQRSSGSSYVSALKEALDEDAVRDYKLTAQGREEEVWAMTEALEALTAVYSWAEYGDDEDGISLSRYLLAKLKNHPNLFNSVCRLYMAIMWKVCTLMGDGTPFSQALKDTLGDRDWLGDQWELITDRPKRDDRRDNGNGGKSRRDRSRSRNPRNGKDHRDEWWNKEKKTKGGKKGKGKGKKDRSPPRKDGKQQGNYKFHLVPEKMSAADWDERCEMACPDYDQGKYCKKPCRNDKKHFCTRCGEPNHGRADRDRCRLG